jgi:hypothetical protein
MRDLTSNESLNHTRIHSSKEFYTVAMQAGASMYKWWAISSAAALTTAGIIGTPTAIAAESESSADKLPAIFATAQQREQNLQDVGTSRHASNLWLRRSL